MFVCVHIYIYVHIFLHNIHGIGDRVVEQEEAVLHVKERERETHTESEPICKYVQLTRTLMGCSSEFHRLVAS